MRNKHHLSCCAVFYNCLHPIWSNPACCFYFTLTHRARVVPAVGFKAVVTRGPGGAMQLCCTAVWCGRNWPAGATAAKPLHTHQQYTLADRRPRWQQDSLPGQCISVQITFLTSHETMKGFLWSKMHKMRKIL